MGLFTIAKVKQIKDKFCNFAVKKIYSFFPEYMDVRIEQSWKQHLAAEWDKDYFARLTSWVRSEYASTQVFPPAGRIFAALDTTPFDDVKVVILGQDPYHDIGQANGLCFSVAPGVAMPPSLVNIFKEVWKGKILSHSHFVRWQRLNTQHTQRPREASRGSLYFAPSSTGL